MLTNPHTSQAAGNSSLMGTVVWSVPQKEPSDLAGSESERLERKRERNRLAAQQCRKRKLEKIRDLSLEVNVLKNVNSHERAKSKRLKEEIEILKQTIRNHKISCGCDLNIDVEL